MNATTAAKEIIRIGSTAGLSKDVIDLMEKKLVLLTDELATAQQSITKLEVENRQLKTQVQNSLPVAGVFHEFAGVLWKRTNKGFEKFPYCKECSHHPIMIGQPPMRNMTPMFWQCSNGHNAPYAGLPTI